MALTRPSHIDWRKAASLAGLLLLSLPASAAVFTDCGILSSFDGGFDQASATCAAGDADRGGTASASAAIGTLSADASVFSALKGPTVATSNATWFDTILINAPGVAAGESAQIFFGYALQGSLNASGHGRAAVSLAFGSCDQPLCSPGIGLEGFEVTETSGDPAVGLTGEHWRFIRFGDVTGLSMRLLARAEKREAFEAPFGGAAEVNFTGTAYWGGILDVRHNGVSVPFTLETGSGVDLRQSFQPVPLAPAVWLMAPALASLALGARWQRTRRRTAVAP